MNTVEHALKERQYTITIKVVNGVPIRSIERMKQNEDQKKAVTYSGHVKKNGVFVPYWREPIIFSPIDEEPVKKSKRRETRALKRYRATHND